MPSESRIASVLRGQESELLSEWMTEQAAASAVRRGQIEEAEVREQAAEFLRLLAEAAATGNIADIRAPAYDGVRRVLEDLSRSRGALGFTPSETATFVFSLKKPLFARLRREHGNDAGGLFADVWTATELLDRLALYTTEVHQRSREETIVRQQQEMLELSTPVVKLWEGILALPLIGTLDSNRTQVVMETLLQRIVDTSSEVAIIDITGVPTVDTLVAQHLMKTVAAARLMGVECIISGIRPQIAQTIVHLAVDLGNVVTKATLAEALRLAMARLGAVVTRKRD